jgi:hypothetical protein
MCTSAESSSLVLQIHFVSTIFYGYTILTSITVTFCTFFWYPNHTEGTNREKKDIFVVAVRSAGGDTLPVNLTVIPSGQKWVFDTIYKTAFPYLYTCEVCSMNRLVLTDEDKSAYEPFECAIETTNYFKNSKVMLCTFHAIWMAMKTDLYTLLDEIEHGGVLSEKWFIIV